MALQRLHHVAYRCIDAAETKAFYTEFLDLDFNMAIAENEVPSTGEWSPHIHIFFEMEDGSSIAFFELPEDDGGMRDEKTPEWVQHLALKVNDLDILNTYKSRLEAGGIEVIGPTNHTFCQSIYFFDPNGHRLELTVDTMTPELEASQKSRAEERLADWSKTKRAPDVDHELHANARNDSAS